MWSNSIEVLNPYRAICESLEKNKIADSKKKSKRLFKFLRDWGKKK